MKKNALWMTMLLGSFAMSAPIEAKRYNDNKMEKAYDEGKSEGLKEGKKLAESEVQQKIDQLKRQLNDVTSETAILITSIQTKVGESAQLQSILSNKDSELQKLKLEKEQMQ